MALLQSLDPRVTRLGLDLDQNPVSEKDELDQFETFEVFLQPKEGRPYEHAGIVHAPNMEMAFLFGKEQYSRRFTCVAMAVASTRSVQTTPITENGVSVYEQTTAAEAESNANKRYEVFHLYKRGQHVKHEGSVPADSDQEALRQAKRAFGDQSKPVLAVWLIPSDELQFVDDEDKDLWNTLSEKLYRDALAYKAGDKLKDFKEQRAAARA